MALTPTEARLLDALPPYYGGTEDPDPTVLAWIRAVAAECDRIRGLLLDLRDKSIPAKADGPALARWEAALGLPINPPLDSNARRAAIVAALLSRNAVSAVAWRAAISTALGGAAITVEENTPTAYRLRVGIPFTDDGGYLAGWAGAIIRERAPANQVVQIIYSGGFIVGTSLVGDTI